MVISNKYYIRFNFVFCL